MTRRHCAAMLVPTVCIFFPPFVQAQDLEAERIGWTIEWAGAMDFPGGFRRRVEQKVAILLAEHESGLVHWMPISDEQRRALRGIPLGAALYQGTGLEWIAQYDELIIVKVERLAGRWWGAASACAPWLSGGLWISQQSVTDHRLVSIMLAELLREAWVPLIRVASCNETSVELTVSSVVATEDEEAATKWKGGTPHRVLVSGGPGTNSKYRLLKHGFVRLGTPPSMNGSCRATLLAIPSDTRAINNALKAGGKVVLAPACPRPGPIRIRPINKSTGTPLSNVEIYASTVGHKHGELKGVTSATGDPVEFSDAAGSFWYVTLKTGDLTYRICILNAGKGEVFEFPIAIGTESYVAEELSILVEEFNLSYKSFERTLRKADDLAKQRRFTAAYQAYEAARKVCPNADSFCRQADLIYRRHHREEDEDRGDRALVSQRKVHFRQAASACAVELKDRIHSLSRTEDLASRRKRAEELSHQAVELRDDQQIAAALARFDMAIEVLPPKDSYAADLAEQRERLANSWKIRGGQDQRRARQFVFDQLGLVTPEQAARDVGTIQSHVECLINNNDVHSMRWTIKILDAVLDRLIAAANDASGAKDAERASRFSETAKKLISLRNRLYEALRAR